MLAVSATRVRTAPMVDRIESYGDLVPLRSVNIVPDGRAQVTALLFEDGSEVESGKSLVVLDDRVARAQLLASRAQAAADQQNLDRIQSLASQGINSRYALEQAQSRAAASRSELQIRERWLDQLTLAAPFAGRLGSHRVDVGAFVNGGDTIVRLDDVSELKVEFRMPSSVALQATNGMPVQLRVPNAGDVSFAGKLSFIDPTVSTDTRSVLLRAVVPNTERRLRPGMFVRVAFTVAVHPKALIVPVEAVMRELNTAYVFAVDDKGIARQTTVTLGLSDDASIEVVSGVHEGEQVVTVGQFKLRDGDRIKIIPEPGRSVEPGRPKDDA